MMSQAAVKIATRKSPLALWQANHVKNQLQCHYSGLRVELVELVCEGDKTLDIPLSQAGGKGLFLKELESALLERSVDLAVHSMKDVTVSLPDGLHIPVVCERGNPYDAFISNKYTAIEEMPAGAVVGTCSLRRQCQISARFPYLALKHLRGNVNTRLMKLDRGEYDAIILAVAGLKRLGMNSRIAQVLPDTVCLPAVTQGIVGIECRVDNERVNQLITPLNHPETYIQVVAERKVNEKLAGGCHAPVAVFSQLHGKTLTLRALVGKTDGSKILQSQSKRVIHSQADAEQLGETIAKDLLNQGAAEILTDIYQNT